MSSYKELPGPISLVKPAMCWIISCWALSMQELSLTVSDKCRIAMADYRADILIVELPFINPSRSYSDYKSLDSPVGSILI